MHQLKNKKKFFEYWGNKKQLKYPHKFNAFYEEDVKLAVEWLKEQIPNICVDLLSIDQERIMKKIDEAFPDLCPSGDLIADKQNPQIDDRLCKVCNKPLTTHSSFYDNHTYKLAD